MLEVYIATGKRRILQKGSDNSTLKQAITSRVLHSRIMAFSMHKTHVCPVVRTCCVLDSPHTSRGLPCHRVSTTYLEDFPVIGYLPHIQRTSLSQSIYHTGETMYQIRSHIQRTSLSQGIYHTGETIYQIRPHIQRTSLSQGIYHTGETMFQIRPHIQTTSLSQGIYHTGETMYQIRPHIQRTSLSQGIYHTVEKQCSRFAHTSRGLPCHRVSTTHLEDFPVIGYLPHIQRTSLLSQGIYHTSRGLSCHRVSTTHWRNNVLHSPTHLEDFPVIGYLPHIQRTSLSQGI